MLVILLVTLFTSQKALSAYTDPHCIGGRDGIVHLFEWKWNDIAAECERFLGPYGFCAVQTSPANENRVVTNPNRPWWERYQPVSYKLQTRSGSEAEFRSMVQRCNNAGVRIYVDVVLNHMTGAGGNGHGTAGTYYDAGGLQFPGVPYGPTDFNDYSNCNTWDLNIHNYNNPEEVRNCRLVSLLDLRMEKDYVRQKAADFLNHLLDLGVAGFRVDAAKHMWPGDIIALFHKVKSVTWGGQPFVFQEVIDQGGEPIKAEEYFATGRVTNFKFGLELARVFRRQNAMKWLSNFGVGWGMWSSEKVVNFIDNHDNQRGHGGGGGVLTHWEPRPYKLATAFMLAHPYGMPRVMSSFEYNRANDYEGPPHNGDMSIKDVTLSGMICNNGWSCEHRWSQIYNMIAFRNMARGTPIANWWSGADYQIAFSRGNKAFIALNLEGFEINQMLQTGLPAGTYCDVISGNYENGQCTGSSVTVGGDGRANIRVCSSCDDPMVAIHVGAKVGSPAQRY
ncbi:alpha-amylase [Biomphalaria pfeifferi]|uniref:Alpha-amylase n=1 Tax=Biomphalaria pfeifferi TaxID=112525 RepID=A0AAD8BUB2_BIOPF|nr:alpha-amylase [Biomphalaria pfeifferi]